jgi:hypothetical protein
MRSNPVDGVDFVDCLGLSMFEADVLVVKTDKLTTDEGKKFFVVTALKIDAVDLVVKAGKLTTDAGKKFCDARALKIDEDDLVVEEDNLTTVEPDYGRPKTSPALSIVYTLSR